jgi:hypothetical protein
MVAPNNNKGMTYQTDEKHLTNLLEYFVGVVKLAYCSLNTYLPLRVFTFTNYLLKYLSHWTLKKLVKCYVYEFWGHPGCLGERKGPHWVSSCVEQYM